MFNAGILSRGSTMIQNFHLLLLEKYRFKIGEFKNFYHESVEGRLDLEKREKKLAKTYVKGFILKVYYIMYSCI